MLSLGYGVSHGGHKFWLCEDEGGTTVPQVGCQLLWLQTKTVSISNCLILSFFFILAMNRSLIRLILLEGIVLTKVSAVLSGRYHPVVWYHN